MNITYEKKDGKLYITVPQAKVSEDNEVFVYRISVLNKNGSDDTQLKKNNLDVSDLIESLRVKGLTLLTQTLTFPTSPNYQLSLPNVQICVG